jgi:hypothetical protein
MAQTSARAKRKSSTASPPPQEEPGRAPVCPVGFCPIGMALTSVQGAGPEVLDHLLSAAREFLLAAKAIVDARVGDAQPGSGSGGLERIEIA